MTHPFRRAIPAILICGCLLFMLTPQSEHILWKDEGDGRHFTHAGVISFRGAGLNFAERYTNGGPKPEWDISITWTFPPFCVSLILSLYLVVRDLRRPPSAHRFEVTSLRRW